MKSLTNIFTKSSRLLIAISLFATVLVPIAAYRRASAATLQIVSPANGQEYSGNSFTISGTATPNAAILLSKSGITIKQTRADGSGNWSATLSNLPDGNNPISVKAITNSGYAYFNTVNNNFSSVKTNQLRLSDNAINPVSPYPVQQNTVWLGLLPSVNNDKLMQFGSALGSKPAVFDAVNPAAVTEATNYPDNAQANTGTFNADSTKYYSPNMALPSISVIDPANNAWVKDITLPGNPVTAWLGPNGYIYVLRGTSGQAGIWIIDPATDTIRDTVSLDCGNDRIAPTVIFSVDKDYPYYYATCFGSSPGKIIKLKLSDNSVVWTVPTDIAYSNGILNGDNSKLYLASTAAQGWGGTPNTASDKIYVHGADNGTLDTSVQMTEGVVGIAQSPDLQHIYAATPGKSIPLIGNGFDILDMLTNTKTHITTEEPLAFVTTQPRVAELAVGNVTVVLGVKTAGSLANTGALAISSTLLAGIIIATFAYTYWDYRRHKQPLVADNPDAQHTYTYLHHVRVVTIPLLKYRVNVSFARSTGSDSIHRF